jgi:hypothetical protein
LNVHGTDIETIILQECKSIDEAKEVGLYYSNLWNVVEDDKFANLIPEYGQGGSAPAKLRKNHPGWRGFKMVGELNPSKRQEVKDKISSKLQGRAFSVEWRKKLSDAATGKISPKKGKPNPYAKTDHMNIIVTCPHCDQTGPMGAMKRWHFDNCKESPNYSPKTMKCPHCDKIGSNSGMKRFHFDNCKKKKIEQH